VAYLGAVGFGWRKEMGMGIGMGGREPDMGMDGFFDFDD